MAEFIPYDPNLGFEGSVNYFQDQQQPGGQPNFSTGNTVSDVPSEGGGGKDSFANQDWFQQLLKFGLGYLAQKFLGGRTTEEKNLAQFSTAGFGSPEIQRFLPLALQAQFTEPLLGAGMSGIADLLARPGGLSPSVADAIRPRLATES